MDRGELIILPQSTRSDLTLSVTLKPLTREELVAQIARASRQEPGFTSLDLSALGGMVEHQPEDMTAAVEAGMKLSDFQDHLLASGQWLPLDPPGADRLSIGDLLAHDRFGPRRLGYGRARDYLIGIKVALADGTLIKAGGKVVKNVAGYDLCKLFIGAHHTIGIIVEATFKLRPLPEKESFVHTQVTSLEDLETLRKRLLASPAEPVVFDAHNLDGSIQAVAAFAGNIEDVDAQVEIAREIGFVEASPADYSNRFAAVPNVENVSVLPSRTVAEIKRLEAKQWLAHLGFGCISHLGGNATEVTPASAHLQERVRLAYDPNRTFSLLNDRAI